MDVDTILRGMNDRGVQSLLIGGMNFLLRHEPVLTFDVDLWIEDSIENRIRTEQALADLHAEWGADDSDWRPAAARAQGWLDAQTIFCLTSPAGAIDIFRAVAGLGTWQESRQRGLSCKTAAGTAYVALSDEDMLRSQMALPADEQKIERVRFLRRLLQEKS